MISEGNLSNFHIKYFHEVLIRYAVYQKVFRDRYIKLTFLKFQVMNTIKWRIGFCILHLKAT